MNVTCPNCTTVYRVDPAKVPAAGVRARCAICAAVFAVSTNGDQPVAQVSAPAPAPATAPAPVPPPAPATAAPPPAAPGPAMRPAASGIAQPAGIGGTYSRTGSAAPPPAGAPPRPATPAYGPGSPPRAPIASPARPAAVPPAAAPPAHGAGAAPQTPSPSVGSGYGSPPEPPSAAPSPRPAAGPARVVNPFLAQDPSAKARRLARALISDMVVYHPAKRQEGLRDGTLKALFEEEIQKSWEEYTDQVGHEIAESTPYFREALNEILADGRALF